MIGIIDYGMGNLQSVKNSFDHIGAESKIVKTRVELQTADSLVLPGVGSFAEGMRNLNERGFVEEIKTQVKERFKPFLGICLGMQLLADSGTEGGETPGLRLIPGTVKRLDTDPIPESIQPMRLPHVGWNSINIIKGRGKPLLTEALAVDYYFVHSYYFETKSPDDVIAYCQHDYKLFPCIVGDNATVFGVQFHPEKSHQYGLQILKNFADLTCLKNA